MRIAAGKVCSGSAVVGHKERVAYKSSITNQVGNVGFGMSRGKQLPTPKLLFASVQINIQAGQLPKLVSNGKHYLKIPIR